MAKGEGGFSKKEMAKLSKSLDSQVSAYQKALKNLSKDLDELQKGSDGVAYWSGQLAYNWIKTALAHVDHDKVLLDHLDNCSEHLERTVHGGSSL